MKIRQKVVLGYLGIAALTTGVVSAIATRQQLQVTTYFAQQEATEVANLVSYFTNHEIKKQNPIARDQLRLNFENNELLSTALADYTPLHQTTIATVQWSIVFIALISAGCGAFILATSYWLFKSISKPNQKLQQARHNLINNSLETRVEIQSQNEPNELTISFNKIMCDLQKARAELDNTNQHLQSEISDRQQIEATLKEALKDLQKAQNQMNQAEKISSLDQLMKGIIHEMLGPINLIYSNISYVQGCFNNLIENLQLYQMHYPASNIQAGTKKIDLDCLQQDLPKTLDSLKVETDRIRQIIFSFHNLSHVDEAEPKLVDIHEGIDNVLLILQHRLKANPNRPEIQIVRNYDVLPHIECYAGQLNQAFMHILVHAIDALDNMTARQSYQEIQENSSTIKIQTSVVNSQWVEVAIADNAPHISESINQHLFEPFSTTTSTNERAEIGIVISHQIITEKHNGKFHCVSTRKTGTEFIIHIPTRQQAIK